MTESLLISLIFSAFWLPFAGGIAQASPPLFLVCATDTMDHLPPGIPFQASPQFIARARAQVARASDPMDRSDYGRQDFSIFFAQRVEWTDGSAVALTCKLNTTLHQLEGLGYTLKSAKTTTIHPSIRNPDGTPMTPWRKFEYTLEDTATGFPAKLTCESEVARRDPQHPYAPFEKTLLEIGQLQNMLFSDFNMQIRTETDPARCSAIQGQNALNQAGNGTNPAQGLARPQAGQRPSKASLPPPTEPGPARITPPAAGPARADSPDGH